MDTSRASEVCDSVVGAVGDAVIADPEFIETVLTGVLSRGHVLVEDVPGTGKTLTANTLARVLGLSFSRIQFTPDLLPADVTGTHVFDESSREFEFRPGPVFANVVLADEINRASPKTQAALLEAMEEKQVTVDGETHPLPEPFFVVATQNPVEQEGTFPLPEAQIDRFMVKTSMGYPPRDDEVELLTRRGERTDRTPEAEQCIDEETLASLLELPEAVRVDRDLREYMVDLGRETRSDDRVEVGVSPRGVQRLYEASRARAVVHGRDYVVPEDVKGVASAVLTHRLVLTAEATVRSVEKAAVLSDVLDRVTVPTD